MQKKLVEIIVKNITASVMLLFFVFIPTVFAVDIGAKTGLDEAATKGFGEGITKESSLPEAIGKVIGVALSLIGIVFLILMIYGGFTWMMARGNESDVTKAKDLIQAAIIGLVVVMSAYAITKFVGDQLVK